MKNILKDKYTWIYSLICIFFILLIILENVWLNLAQPGYHIGWFIFSSLYENFKWVYGIVLFLVINVMSFISIKRGKDTAGIILTILFGTVGSFIAVHTVTHSCKYSKIINIFFLVYLGILSYSTYSFFCVLMSLG